MLFFLAYVFIQPPVTSPNTDSTSNSSSQELDEKPINSSDTTTSTVNYESTLIENFDEVGIKAGEELVFVRDESITCTVHDSATIKFNNEVTNLTAAVKDILDPERTGKTYNGVVFWKYKGKTLWDRRKRIRGE